MSPVSFPSRHTAAPQSSSTRIHSRSLPFLPILMSTKTSVLQLLINPGHSSTASPTLGSTSSTPPHPRSLHSYPSRNATTTRTPNYYPSSMSILSLYQFQPVPQSSAQVRANIHEHQARVRCFKCQSAKICVALSRSGLTSWDRDPFDLPPAHNVLDSFPPQLCEVPSDVSIAVCGE